MFDIVPKLFGKMEYISSGVVHVQKMHICEFATGSKQLRKTLKFNEVRLIE